MSLHLSANAVEQWLERWPGVQEILGSKPGWKFYFFSLFFLDQLCVLIPNLATKFVSLTSKAFKKAFWPSFFQLSKLLGVFSSKFLLHCFPYLFLLLISNLAMKLGSLACQAFKKASTCGGRSPPPTEMAFMQGK